MNVFKAHWHIFEFCLLQNGIHRFNKCCECADMEQKRSTTTPERAMCAEAAAAAPQKHSMLAKCHEGKHKFIL